MIALLFIFSACDDELTVYSDPVEDDTIEVKSEVKNVPEGGYIMWTGNYERVIIDGEVLSITKFRLVNTVDPTDIQFAYCANRFIFCYEGSTYHPVSADAYFKSGEDTQIMAMLNYAINKYRWLEKDNPAGYDQLIQCIIWKAIHDGNFTSIENDAANILEMFHDVLDNFDKTVEEDETNIHLEGEGVSHQGTGYTDYGPFWVSDDGISENVDYTLTLVQDDNSAKFIMDDEEITTVKSGEPFYVRVPEGVIGDFSITAGASILRYFLFVNDYTFYVDARDLDEDGEFNGQPSFQPLFQPLIKIETDEYFYTCSSGFSVQNNENETETITVSCLIWNKGKSYGCGVSINQFKVNGITLKNYKNYLTPAKFDFAISQAPKKYAPTAIYTFSEKIVKNNRIYEKIYQLKVALYENNSWKGYAGTIIVDIRGGTHAHQKIELERIF